MSIPPVPRGRVFTCVPPNWGYTFTGSMVICSVTFTTNARAIVLAGFSGRFVFLSVSLRAPKDMRRPLARGCMGMSACLEAFINTAEPCRSMVMIMLPTWERPCKSTCIPTHIQLLGPLSRRPDQRSSMLGVTPWICVSVEPRLFFGIVLSHTWKDELLQRRQENESWIERTDGMQVVSMPWSSKHLIPRCSTHTNVRRLDGRSTLERPLCFAVPMLLSTLRPLSLQTSWDTTSSPRRLLTLL